MPRALNNALTALVVGLALALRWPLLRTGFIVDDFAQLAMMRGLYYVPRRALELFTFSNGSALENLQLTAAGFFPWWSNEQLKVSLFRPLSCALMWCDLQLFGLDAHRSHLHTVVWWLGMMVALAFVLRRILPSGPALLALALCCAHGCHGMFLGWLANRNAIVCSGFALLGLGLTLGGATTARSPRRVAAALVAYALALSGGEYALGFVAYPLCRELQLAQTRRQRLLRALPWCSLLVCYLALRHALGFGTYGSGMYLDPFRETPAFVAAASSRFPVLVGDLVLGIQANWWAGAFPWAQRWASSGLIPLAWATDLRPLQAVQVGFGWAALAIGSGLAAVVWKRRPELRWVVVATPLSLLPSLGSTPESRLLFQPLLGWAVIAASYVHASFVELARRRPGGSAQPMLAAVAGSAVYASQLLGPPLYLAPVISGMPALAEQIRGSILARQLDPVLEGKRVLMLGAADATTTIYVALMRRVHGRPAPKACQLLSATGDPQRLERLSSTSFALERLGTHLTPLDTYATAFNREPLRAGQSFRVQGMRVTVERALEGRPMRTRFELDVPLDDPQIVLVQQTVNGLERRSFPAVGTSVLVEPPMPPFAWAASTESKQVP